MRQFVQHCNKIVLVGGRDCKIIGMNPAVYDLSEYRFHTEVIDATCKDHMTPKPIHGGVRQETQNIQESGFRDDRA